MSKIRGIFLVFVFSFFLSCNTDESNDLIKLKQEMTKKFLKKIDLGDLVTDIEWDKVRFVPSHYPRNYEIDSIDLRKFKGFLEDYSEDENVVYMVFYDKSRITGFIETSFFDYENLSNTFYNELI